MTTPTIFLDRKDLSQILRKQLGKYNEEHSTAPLDYEQLYSHALAYIDPKHYIRYQVLSYYFDSDAMPDFIKKVEKNYLRNHKHAEKLFDEYAEMEESENPFFVDTFDNENDDSDDYTDFCNYMNGKYFFGNKQPPKKQAGTYAKIKNPSEIFYTLARILQLDEKELITAFYEGDGLDIRFYSKMYVYDIISYYFQKSGFSVTPLCAKIESLYGKNINMKSSKVSKLIYGQQDISYDDFLILAYALEIPEVYIENSKYRLAQRKDPFSYKAGYDACLADIKEMPDEMGNALGLAILTERKLESIAIKKKPRIEGDEVIDEFVFLPSPSSIIHNYFDCLGYDISIMNEHLVSVTFPDGEIRILPTAEYKKFLETFRYFAEFTLYNISNNQE